MIRALLWDLGGVLCHFRPRRRLDAFVRASGATEPDVRCLLSDTLLGSLDAGATTSGQLLALVRARLGWDCTSDELAQAWSAAFDPNLAVLALAQRVNVPAALLTNNGPPLSDAYALLLPTVAAAVPTALFSGETRLAKPQPAAFSHACEILNTEPSAVLFVDDADTNVRAAAATGLRVHHFQGVAGLAQVLEREGVLA